ncbi:hypothetical protein [Sphingomonas trueperi]|uniref:hypothetical protein n=1 Tax=Sphingomonas trueperi TaxID=53317 RepID=UPI000EADCCBC
MGPWGTLGIDPTDDTRAIRKAYARLLKAMDPETDPEGFAALRHARDWAMYLAEQQAQAEAPEEGKTDLVVTVDADVRTDAGDSPAPVADAAAPEPVAAARAPDVAAPDVAPDLREQADFEALHALHAMVFDRSRRISQEEMTALVEHILADPAMQNLAHADNVEGFFADTIAQGTPRSDPLIDPAIAYFRWDSADAELHRSPVVNWILQRSRDRVFEVELRLQNRRMYQYLRRLRQPPPTGVRGWIDAWRAGPRVEYILAYCQTYHPTIVNGLDEASHDWWVERSQRLRAAAYPFGEWYRGRCNNELDKPIERTRAFNLRGLASLLPLLLFFGAMLLRQGEDDSRQRYQDLVDRAVRSAAHAPVVPPMPNLVDVDHDLEELLNRFTNGELSVVELQTANPALYARLKREWNTARAQRGSDPHLAFETLVERVGGILSKLMTRALRDGDEKLVLDYAAYYEARLRWAERAAPEECVALIDGGNSGAGPSDLHDRRYGLLARAIRTGMPPADDVKDTGRYTISPALLEDAMARARLDRAAFDQALQREGPQLAICNSRIALIDAALVRRDKLGLTLLRGMFGG